MHVYAQMTDVQKILGGVKEGETFNFMYRQILANLCSELQLDHRMTNITAFSGNHHSNLRRGACSFTCLKHGTHNFFIETIII